MWRCDSPTYLEDDYSNDGGISSIAGQFTTDCEDDYEDNWHRPCNRGQHAFTPRSYTTSYPNSRHPKGRSAAHCIIDEANSPTTSPCSGSNTRLKPSCLKRSPSPTRSPPINLNITLDLPRGKNGLSSSVPINLNISGLTEYDDSLEADDNSQQQTFRETDVTLSSTKNCRKTSASSSKRATSSNNDSSLHRRPSAKTSNLQRWSGKDNLNTKSPCDNFHNRSPKCSSQSHNKEGHCVGMYTDRSSGTPKCSASCCNKNKDHSTCNAPCCAGHAKHSPSASGNTKGGCCRMNKTVPTRTIQNSSRGINSARSKLSSTYDPYVSFSTSITSMDGCDSIEKIDRSTKIIAKNINEKLSEKCSNKFKKTGPKRADSRPQYTSKSYKNYYNDSNNNCNSYYEASAPSRCTKRPIPSRYLLASSRSKASSCEEDEISSQFAHDFLNNFQDTSYQNYDTTSCGSSKEDIGQSLSDSPGATVIKVSFTSTGEPRISTNSPTKKPCPKHPNRAVTSTPIPQSARSRCIPSPHVSPIRR